MPDHDPNVVALAVLPILQLHYLRFHLVASPLPAATVPLVLSYCHQSNAKRLPILIVISPGTMLL